MHVALLSMLLLRHNRAVTDVPKGHLSCYALRNEDLCDRSFTQHLAFTFRDAYMLQEDALQCLH